MSTTANGTKAQAGAELLAAARHGSADEADRMSVNTDRSGYTPGTLPDGVVYATSVDDVVETMIRATAGRIQIVARGAGTGLAAGSSAQAGEIVLDLSGMNRVLRLDPLEQLIVVEPGVLNARSMPPPASTASFTPRIRPAPRSAPSAETLPPTPVACVAPSTASPGNPCWH